MRYWLAAAVAAVALAGGGGAHAGEAPLGIIAGISGGVLAHGVEAISRSTYEGGPAFNGEIDFVPLWHQFGGTFSPDLGASVATAGATSYVYADIKYELDLASGWFLSAGIGGAVHNGKLDASSPDHNALGSRLLFHVPLEAGYAFSAHYRAAVYFEHVSNGYLAKPNEGLDNAGVRLHYRF